MKNNAAFFIRKQLNNYLKKGLDKSADCWSTHTVLLSDEQLQNSFDSFIVDRNRGISIAEMEALVNDLKILEELLSVLDKVGERFIVQVDQHEGCEIPREDSSNRLYASLKRHPE